MTGVLWSLPVLTPRLVTITTGMSRKVVPSRPPELSYRSTWSLTHCDGLGSYSPVRGMMRSYRARDRVEPVDGRSMGVFRGQGGRCPLKPRATPATPGYPERP